MTTSEDRWRYARRAALILVGVAAAAWLLATPVVCRDAVAGSSVVRVCEPIGPTDVRVVGAALLVALLAVGDVGEIGLGGVTLKRAVAEVRAEVEDTRRDVSDLRLAVVNNVTVYSDRSAASEQPAEDAAADGLDPSALIAFRAGVRGLRALLPSWVQDATLIGYDVGDDGQLVPHTVRGSTDEERRAAAQLLDEQRDVPVVMGHERSSLLLAASVTDGAGRRIGGLVVVVRRTGGARPAATADEALMTAMSLVTAAYSRLWRTLLGGRALWHLATSEDERSMDAWQQ